MTGSSTEVARWVVQHVSEDAVRTAKILAIRHDVRIAIVLEMALEAYEELLSNSEDLVAELEGRQDD